jgi:hypothetical protein
MEDQTLCVQCRSALATKDWTCPRCGAIVDRYLFSTVKLKSLGGESRNSYQSGYQACKEQARQTGSTAIRAGSYHPNPGHVTAYRAGWQAAAIKLEGIGDRKFGRRRGLRVLGSGVVSLLIGIGIAAAVNTVTGGHVTLIVLAPIGLGVVGIVIGFMMILTGEPDDARPDS